MEVAMPMSGATSAMDCYEDMFKEITRKLYGEEGLPDLSSNDRISANSISNDYEVDGPIFKTDEHITAFGLAALMQNGFPSAAGILNSSSYQPQKPNPEDKWIISEDDLQWTQSKIASYNPYQKLFRCAECDCVGYLARVAEHWLGTHANLRVFQCPQCPYASAWARCVRMHLTRQHNINSEDTTETLLKENPVLHEITRFLQRLKTRLENNCAKANVGGQMDVEDFPAMSASGTAGVSSVPRPAQQSLSTSTESSNVSSNKRYSCTYCPYATDRRDLFTRHENIHREEKPFQCYVCQKQFNRADHVKKHFLRMHREHPYDLNRIRRHPPKNASGMSYYHKYNSNGAASSTDANGGMQHPLTIPTNFGTVNRNNANISRIASSPDIKTGSISKSGPPSKSSSKKKGDKKYSCCYCSWSGVDNWCLKRHLNTHLKPFICALCDYKAARSERLATHVLKVHNKRACGRCLFLADDQVQLAAHQQEHHPLEQRSNRIGSSNTLRNAATFNSTSTVQSTSYGHGSMTSSFKSYELSAAAALLQHGGRLLPMSSSMLPNNECKSWKPYTPKQHGAARLFNYMEASDGSDLECDAATANDDSNRIQLNSRNQSDFPEAGDVGNSFQIDLNEEINEELELPLFICRECGCEFVDDISLETHQLTLHRIQTASPANQIKKVNKTIKSESKENIIPKFNYTCSICHVNLQNQSVIMKHMVTHVNINSDKSVTEKSFKNINKLMQQTNQRAISNKRSRKQRKPKKMVISFWDSKEIQVLRRVNDKLRNLRKSGVSLLRLEDKHLAHLITRKGLSCNLCKNSKYGPMFPYHTKGSLALHCFWRHSQKNQFRCEHCYMSFKHCYQVVLHSSREHINVKQAIQFQKSDYIKQIVPKLIKEPIVRNSSVPASENSHNFIHMSAVPDTNNVHKLSIPSYFDHTFIHSSTHMPIIIPTFPPS